MAWSSNGRWRRSAVGLFIVFALSCGGDDSASPPIEPGADASGSAGSAAQDAGTDRSMGTGGKGGAGGGMNPGPDTAMPERSDQDQSSMDTTPGNDTKV